MGEELVITIEGDKDREDDVLIVGEEENNRWRKIGKRTRKGKNTIQKAYK